MILSKFRITEDGNYRGVVGGLGFTPTEVITEKVTSLDDKPYLKLVADPHGDVYEIGAAFPKEKDGLKYYSVSLDSPLLPAPINAALFPDRKLDGVYNLVWNRPEPKASADATAEVATETTNDQTVQSKNQKRRFIRRAPANAPSA